MIITRDYEEKPYVKTAEPSLVEESVASSEPGLETQDEVMTASDKDEVLEEVTENVLELGDYHAGSYNIEVREDKFAIIRSNAGQIGEKEENGVVTLELKSGEKIVISFAWSASPEETEKKEEEKEKEAEEEVFPVPDEDTKPEPVTTLSTEMDDAESK
jgi:hypothetical protein